MASAVAMMMMVATAVAMIITAVTSSSAVATSATATLTAQAIDEALNLILCCLAALDNLAGEAQCLA